MTFDHRVYRAPGFLSSRTNWPSPASECVPRFGSGGDTLACARGGGGPNADEGTDIVVPRYICTFCSPPPFGSKRGDTLAAGEGAGGSNSDEETDTLAL
jgi:hypothetical protein